MPARRSTIGPPTTIPEPLRIGRKGDPAPCHAAIDGTANRFRRGGRAEERVARAEGDCVVGLQADPSFAGGTNHWCRAEARPTLDLEGGVVLKSGLWSTGATQARPTIAVGLKPDTPPSLRGAQPETVQAPLARLRSILRSP